MSEIKEKEIMMPVTVLWKGCEGCERLDITIGKKTPYADSEEVATQNNLRCTYVYECKRNAQMFKRMMDKE